MGTTPKHNSDDQEIDLSQISKKIGKTYENFLSWIFGGFLFIKRNIIILGILFLIGSGLGFYLDKTSTAYDHEIIITPNFGSTEYVYSKVTLINSKIKEHDSIFFKSIGILNPKEFVKIEIEPINDIYNFIDNKEQNFELIKLMAEDGDITKIIEDETTSKNYSNHKLKIISRGEINRKQIIDPILNYLNQSEYYAKVQKSIIESIHIKIDANKRTISQIDSLLANFSSSTNQNGKNDKLVYYNENTQLNDILGTKNGLIQELANKKVELISSDKIIKEKSAVLNIENTKTLNGKYKMIIPFILVVLFMLVVFIKAFYKREMAKLNNK